jgi:hypothetical protein
MTRQLQERASLLGVVVAILAFGITYGKTVDLMTAVGAVGLAYLLVGCLGTVYLSGRGAWRVGPVIGHPIVTPLLGILVLLGLLSWDWSRRGWSLHHPLLLALGGVALMVLPPCLVAFAVLAYRAKHKTCPECANEVLSAARVCQYCGYRWEPPLASLNS